MNAFDRYSSRPRPLVLPMPEGIGHSRASGAGGWPASSKPIAATPVPSAPHPESDDVEADRAPEPTTPPRILYVEDSPLQARYVSTVLESAGYSVLCCEDPFKFQEALAGFRPELVLMDIVLPGKTGYELVRGLREAEEHQTLPVLFLTTESEIQARIEATRAGGDDHLVKPVGRDLLLSAVGSRIERSRKVKAMMNRDGLTRLYTAKALLEAADELVDHQRNDATVRATWAMLDLDHFKTINDRYGHPTGDRVLTALAALLRRNLRTQDVVGRCGGEEFAILLEGIEENEAFDVVERLRTQFAGLRHDVGDGTSFSATFSAGLASLRLDASVESWRSAADRALYVAKARGRNCVAMQGLTDARNESALHPLTVADRRELPTKPLALRR